MTHLRTARNPMSEARRQHLHGALEGLPDDRPIWPAVWWLVSRSAVVALPIGTVWLLIIAFS